MKKIILSSASAALALLFLAGNPTSANASGGAPAGAAASKPGTVDEATSPMQQTRGPVKKKAVPAGTGVNPGSQGVNRGSQGIYPRQPGVNRGSQGIY